MQEKGKRVKKQDGQGASRSELDKVKRFFRLTDEGVEAFLQYDFRRLALENKDAFIRLAGAYGGAFIAVLLYLAVLSVSGIMTQLIVSTLFFGAIAGAVYAIGLENVNKATKHPIVSYYLLFLFGIVALSMFFSVCGGGFIAKFFLLMIVGGLGYGGYFVLTVRKMPLSVVQVVLAGLFVAGYVFSVQASFVSLAVEQEMNALKRRNEIRRLKEADEMRRSMASSKTCMNEEECKKINTKKNYYYAQHEDETQEVCEQAVSKEIPSRFEWTVSAKDYKFPSYTVDVLNDTITVMGDLAQLVNRDGSRTRISYTCKYNVKSKTATATVLKKTDKENAERK